MVCFCSQMWVLKHVIGNFVHDHPIPANDPVVSAEEPLPGSVNIHFKRWLMFMPTILFGVAIDLQFTYQVKNYKPKAFVDLPSPHVKTVGFVFSIASLLASIATIVLSFLTFAALVPQVNKSWVFDCFIIKAVCWAPFLGWEFYDLLFEHLYLDV